MGRPGNAPTPHPVLQVVVIFLGPHHGAIAAWAAHVKVLEGGVVGHAVDVLALHNHAWQKGEWGGRGGGRSQAVHT